MEHPHALCSGRCPAKFSLSLVARSVMAKVGDGCAVFKKLLRRKIIVRPLKGYGLPEWVRISVGTMEENKKLITALRELIRRQ